MLKSEARIERPEERGEGSRTDQKLEGKLPARPPAAEPNTVSLEVIPSQTLQDIRALNRSLHKLASERETLSRELAEEAADFRELYARAGWRETKLPPWLCRLLGGDVHTLYRVRIKVGEWNKSRERVAKLDRKVTDTSRRIDASLKEALAEHDPLHRDLLHQEREIDATENLVANYLKKVDYTLREVAEAKGAESLDLASKSVAMSNLSVKEIREARDAVGRLREASEELEQALQKRNAGINPHHCKLYRSGRDRPGRASRSFWINVLSEKNLGISCPNLMQLEKN